MTLSKRRSIVQFMGEDVSTCGYCRCGRESSVSSGMWCHTLTVEEYQLLIDRGWRRSGCWLYKPNMQCTCCPQYAIRLDVHKFKPNKEQKRVLTKWSRFLAGEPRPAGHAQPATPQVALYSELANEDGQNLAGEAANSDKRQKLDKEGKLATDSCTDRVPSDLPRQNHQQVNQAAVNDPLTAPLQSVVKEALQACMASGQLPESDMPQVRLAVPSVKQATKLPEGVRLSSPVALALAGLYRKRQGPSAMTADQVAVQLGSAINARLGEASWEIRHGTWTALPLRGHLNFSCTSPSPASPPDITKQKGLNSASTAAHHGDSTVSSSCASSSDAAPGNVSETPASDLLAQTWTGLDLTLSMQAALADSSAKGGLKPGTQPRHAVAAATASAESGHASASQAAEATAAAASSVAELRTASADAATPSNQPASRLMRVTSRQLDIRMVPATPELIPVEFPLYKKYQMTNHGDAPAKVTREGFQRFLIDSPFGQVPCSAYSPGTCPPCGFGTFHQQYWLEGKLIAVGVLDVLPHALSSKYFFWDSAYAALSPGKFSALKEAEWVKGIAQHCPALHYYVMGYFIHSCHKMRYKADYEPSDLLCPERFCWIPFARVKAALEAKEYQVLSDVPGATAGLGHEHGLTAEQQRHWDRKLSTAEVPSEVMQASLIFSADMAGGLVRFQDLKHFGIKQLTWSSSFEALLVSSGRFCHLGSSYPDAKGWPPATRVSTKQADPRSQDALRPNVTLDRMSVRAGIAEEQS